MEHQAQKHARRIIAAEEHGRLVQNEAIDEPRSEEGADDARTPFDHQLHDATGAEVLEQAIERAVPRPARLYTARASAVPSTIRSGSVAAGVPSGGIQSRTVSDGSSARTVPAPTRIASLSARNRWASARASAPVIHCEVPSGAAVRPSRLAASLAITHGRPVRR